jgi:hypothetical protein
MIRAPSKPLLLALGWAALAAVVLGAIQFWPSGGGASTGLTVDSPWHDFGRVAYAEDQILEHTFTLRNGTADPVRIVSHTETCGCSQVILPPGPIAARSEAPVTVKVGWGAVAGPQQVQVRLRTDLPATPEVVLNLMGTVWLRAAVSPESVNFGVVGPGEQRARIVWVWSREPDFAVTDVRLPPNVSLRRLSDGDAPAASESVPGGAGSFEVVLTGAAAPGRYGEKLVFLTSIAEHREVACELEAHFSGAFSVSPRTLFFMGKAAAQDLRVEFAGADAPRAVILPPSDGSASPFSIEEVRRMEDGQRNVMIVRVACSAADGPSDGTLRLSAPGLTMDVPLVGAASRDSDGP